MIIEIGVQEILMNDIQNTKSVALKSLSGALVFMTYQPHPRAGRELVARLIHCYSYHWSIDHTKPKGRMQSKYHAVSGGDSAAAKWSRALISGNTRLE